jgi:subtilisin family serine protease
MTFNRPLASEAQGDAAEAPLPFAAAAGRGVRVAAIDSGVNPRHPHIHAMAGGASVGADGGIELDVYTDHLGHGTAVMAAIQEKAPAAEYFAVKVFHNSLRTSAAHLLRAIEWCIEQKMDVVNLSLGTMNPAHAEQFREIAARAVEAGTLLAAAREADGQPCYPGCLPTVFSVGLDWDCPRNRYRCETNPDGTVFGASGYPRPAPGVAPARNLHGISFAVANMTAFIARACEVDGGQRAGGRARRIGDLLLRECTAFQAWQAAAVRKTRC